MSQNIYIQNGVLVIFSKIKAKLKGLHSLRFESLFSFLCIGVLPMLLVTNVISNTYYSKAVSQRVSELQTRGSVIANLVQSSALLTNDVTSEVESELTQVSDFYGGRIMIVDSNFLVLRDTYGLEEGKTLIVKEAIECLTESDAERIVNQESEHIEIFIPIESSSKKGMLGVVVMTFSMTNIDKLFSELSSIGSTIVFLVSILLFLIAIMYSKRLVSPLNLICATIHRIADGDLERTVDLHGCKEIEDVSGAFNEMTGVLHNLEDSRQEFVSNVSHELKTPITSMKVLADSLMMQEEAPVELYKEFMGDINNELERLNHIINDLLVLVKMDKNAVVLQVEEVNINEFIEDILKRLRPIAIQRNIDIVFESFRPVTAQIDSTKMSMAVTNIIENAIKYNYDDGWVRVSLNADHKYFYLKVSDSGVGIPEELQDQIFERFYRVDKARSRETGGNGLGLSIARNAILLHRGSIKVHSVPQQGTTFNIRIPLIFIEQ